MHGRVKVRTSEEEKARKEKERQEKLKIFKHAMKKIQQKRSDSELDKELLEITGQVLVANPDIYTLWNIRRDILNIFKKTEENAEELSKSFDGELNLTEYCLKVNPKSYCAWHHREWVLTSRCDPDWRKELALCDKYLKLDERNFHTWDYRRFVVQQYKPPLKDEFDFTTEKLYENFSNYSAWHYRSKMLVELYPDLEAGRPIEDSHHRHELELVQSAAFTDPDDTSAWFYQRWLLGAVKEATQVVVCRVSPKKTTVAMNKNVSKDFVQSKIKIMFNDTCVDGEWTSCTGNNFDNLWIYDIHNAITDDLDVKLLFEDDNNETQVLSCKRLDGSTYIGKSKISFQRQYSKPVIDELKKQLDSCRQLLDFEPDSKWTLLTTTIFLHCIDPKQHHDETITKLQLLKTIDTLRAGYYDDLITKWNIENVLSEKYDENVDVNLKITLSEKIACLPHLQYFSYCETVDLSNQNLTSRVLPSLVVLQHCKVLNLKNNKLSTLKGFPILQLQELDLSENDSLTSEEIQSFRNRVTYNVIY
ncbi:geranylgeranyl transferase type-2 subunit alpha [Plutella xylostella]|uniref:geranylgeranyl transferase type-2 subunit alpha n=1 Tax=Plutella xylostella TaxID=51655 RepID=UPI0020323B11|nr:geranylgeranyl transferase type-2 subunit alpha [Plutella xylostella]